jgi:ferredoxin-type protein NapG
MANEANGSERPRGRRGFFQHGLLQILTPLSDLLQERLPGIMPNEYLRPPGALPEKEFLQRCYRCGKCIEVCPAFAIRRLSSGDDAINGTPYIDPDIAACSICENLECMRHCPSGALQLVESKFHIRMGLARVRTSTCLRTRSRLRENEYKDDEDLRAAGRDCMICVHRCPLGEDAILLDEDGRIVIRQPDPTGCVGCGICQNLCPATPKAIVVEPR